MRPRILYKPGEELGDYHIKYIAETELNQMRRAIFKCGTCQSLFKARIGNVKYNRTKSCGCLNHLGKITHGDKKRNNRHYLYSTWIGIKTRCYNKKENRWHRYGGRGITVCGEWINSYIKFKEYILDNLGERPEGYSIDRINNDGHYEPGNVRWADASTQMLNRQKFKCKKI